MDRRELVAGVLAAAVLDLSGGGTISAQQPEEPRMDRTNDSEGQGSDKAE